MPEPQIFTQKILNRNSERISRSLLRGKRANPKTDIIPYGRRFSADCCRVFNFIKVEHTAFSLPLVLSGAWIGSAGHFPSWSVLGLIVLAAVGARTFGMSFNRIFDRNIDAANPRTAMRELPRGALSVKTALMVAFGGAIVYLLACTVLGGWCLILSPLPLIPLLSYSLLKRYTPWCHFGIGLCLALAPLGAFVAASGHIRFTWAVVLFAGFVFFWLSGADIIYAILDIDSDRQNNVQSLPARLGERTALRIAAACHVAAVVLISAVFITTDGRGVAAIAMALSALAMGTMYLPAVPVGMRFFPISTIAGIAAAFVPILGYY